MIAPTDVCPFRDRRGKTRGKNSRKEAEKENLNKALIILLELSCSNIADCLSLVYPLAQENQPSRGRWNQSHILQQASQLLSIHLPTNHELYVEALEAGAQIAHSSTLSLEDPACPTAQIEPFSGGPDASV